MDPTYIALGGNLSDPARTLPRAWQAVVQALALQRPRLSRVWWSTAAEGAAGGPRFANAVGLGYTSAPPHAQLAVLHEVEARFGRERRVEGRHGDRPLDLDLIAVGNQLCEDATLTLPHPRAAARDFVLVPLLELAPSWVHPRLGRSGRELLDALPRASRTLQEGA